MITRCRRLLQDLAIPPRNAATVAALLALLLTIGAVVALRPGTSTTTTMAAPEPDPSRPAAKAQAPPTLALGPAARRRFPSREFVGASRSGAAGTRPGPEGAGAWWFGTAGVALALAFIGWGSVAARRYRPLGGSGPVAMRVVGRASLSPKHTVYLLDVGGRVLILGAGAQGAPSLLGELTDPADPAPPRFDHRLGDES